MFLIEYRLSSQLTQNTLNSLNIHIEKGNALTVLCPGSYWHDGL